MSSYSMKDEYDLSGGLNSSSEKLIVVSVDGCSKLNIRSRPEISSTNVVSVLDRGDILEKFSGFNENGFAKVRLTSGKIGWAMAKYLKE